MSAVEISRSEWLQVRDLYLKDWPKHSITYSFVDHALKNEKDDVKLYSHCEDYSDGSLVYVRKIVYLVLTFFLN